LQESLQWLGISRIISVMALNEVPTRFDTDPWFSGLPSPMRQRLLENAVWQNLEPRQALTHGGDTSGGIVGLAEGTALLVPAIGLPDAGPIHLLHAPVWFGLMPLSKSRPRAVAAVAQLPCQVARVSQNAMVSMLNSNPSWWQHVNDLSLTNFMTAIQAAADLHIADSKRRLCAVLLRVAERRHEGNDPVEITISQHDLATMANMSRQTIAHILRRLASTGLVSWNYRSITVRNPRGLRALVEA
jgi:CRP/FNR family transcriptional regulator, cyclic AMP receptor protein